MACLFPIHFCELHCTLSKDSNFPYVYVIIDTALQVVCLEYKTTVFPKIDTCKKALTDFVDRYIHDPNYTFSLDEISDIGSFWDSISNADRVYQLQLNLKSPNLFGGMFTTNELLKKVKTFFNNDECDINLKNAAGNLQVTREAMDDPLEYASSGGGNWRLTVVKKGRKKKTTISSKKSVKTIEVTDFDETYSLIGENSIIEKLYELGGLTEKKENKE